MVEFQYFVGCPHSAATLENLWALVRERVISEAEVVVTEVESPEAGARLKFQGSPTILVDGKDLYTGRVPVGFAFACRTYVLDGTKTGVLGKQYIETRYHELRNSGLT